MHAIIEAIGFVLLLSIFSLYISIKSLLLLEPFQHISTYMLSIRYRQSSPKIEILHVLKAVRLQSSKQLNHRLGRLPKYTIKNPNVQRNLVCSWPRGYKTFSCSTHSRLSMKIFNAHKYKNIKKFSFFFHGQISLECYFFCS